MILLEPALRQPGCTACCFAALLNQNRTNKNKKARQKDHWPLYTRSPSLYASAEQHN